MSREGGSQLICWNFVGKFLPLNWDIQLSVCERERKKQRERGKDKKERQKMASAGVAGEEVGTK